MERKGGATQRAPPALGAAPLKVESGGSLHAAFGTRRPKQNRVSRLGWSHDSHRHLLNNDDNGNVKRDPDDRCQMPDARWKMRMAGRPKATAKLRWPDV